MRHGIVFFYFFTFALGFALIILGSFLHLRHRRRPLRLFLLFAVSLTLILLEQMVTAYDIVNSAGNPLLARALFYLSALGCSLLFYSFTALVRVLMGKGGSPVARWPLAVLSAVPLFASLLSHLLHSRAMLWVANGFFFAAVLYNGIALAVNLQRVDEGLLRSVVRNFLIVTLLMLPLLFVDTFIERIAGIGTYFPFGLFSVSIYYILFSGFGLYYLVRQAGPLLDGPAPAQAPDGTRAATDADRLRECGITAREREIIQLLIRGDSYSSIARQLVIALPTVKSHVYNIYRKLAVRNKIELIQAVSQKSYESMR